MRFGLSEEILAQIKSCFMGYLDIEWVKIYGSRAIGTHEPGSDIDLAFASPVNHAAKIWGALEALPTPYLFDVTHYDSLENQNLKSQIDHKGRLLFTRDDLQPSQLK